MKGDERVDDMVDQGVKREILDFGAKDGLRLAQTLDEPIRERFGDRLLVWKELVDRADGDAGPRRDQVGACRVEADFGEDLGRGNENYFDTALPPDLPSARRPLPPPRAAH